MSSLKAEIVQIDKIEKHPNADRLDLAYFQGYQIVVGRDEFKAGDLAIYIPIDSVLPEELEHKIFGDSKIKLSGHRVKTIKIRSAISQGMLVNPVHLGWTSWKNGQDVTSLLGITKYEPPVRLRPQTGLQHVSKRKTNPHFTKYTDIENFQRHTNIFQPGEKVWVLEKIHGTNFRAGWVKSYPYTFWQKVLNFFHLLPEYEFVFGSHNIQLQTKNKKNFYQEIFKTNVYSEAVEKYDLQNKIPKGYVIYGEIYGDNIQPNFNYGCKAGERKLAIFDIKREGIYLDHRTVSQFGFTQDLPVVPVDAVGEYAEGLVQLLANTSSRLAKDHQREGVVIKPAIEDVCYLGRKILKYKSPEFLLKFEDNTH